MKFLSSRRVNCQNYRDRVPYSFTVVDGLFLPEACRAVAAAFPGANEPGWVHYDSPLERKSVYNDRHGEPEIVQELYDTLGDDGFLDLLEQIAEMEGLIWDDSLHAAGLCVAGRGAKLDLHRDGIRHPHQPLARALTAILFLNERWEPEWNGLLELWSERDSQPFELIEKIEPKLGRLLIFSPHGFHGFPDEICCPAGVERKSVQIFYWQQSADNDERARAAFAPRPTDPESEELDRLRQERTQPSTSPVHHLQ